MPHLKPMNSVICEEPGCTHSATHQLFSTQNRSLGLYCRKHGFLKLTALKRLEEDQLLLPDLRFSPTKMPFGPKG